MAAPRIQRRLAGVLAADVAGFARLMEHDESGTFARLRAHRAEVFEPLVADHRGRIVKHTGDGALCEFASIVDAVACALDIQRRVAERETAVPDGARIRYRIGVNLGDIIVEDDGDIYGDGVNLAARLEALAEPGGVNVSGAAHEHLHGKLDCAFEDLGEKAIKNLERPVRVYRVLPPGAAAAAPAAPKHAAALTLPDRPSIAVLPFDNMSTDPEQDFFADGITEDITTALCKFRGFFVIARNTMFTYKGKAVDVRAVGRELGVRYILEGSVRKLGPRIRVNAQLIEAATSNHLWAERYDRGLEDIFAIQDEITASVVGRIGPEVMAAESARAARKPPHSLDAWECVIRALFHSSQQSEEESRSALGLLDRAIKIDPNYAQALGMKAWIFVFRAFQGWEDMGAALAAAKPLIVRAIAADRDELWPYLAQGMVGYAIRDNELSISALTRAVTLNPNSVNAVGLLGNAHAFGGRADEALRCIDRAIRLSPRDTFLSDFELYYAFAHFQAARYEEALRHAQRSHDLRPGHPYPLVMAAACAGQIGDAGRAAALLRDLKAVLPIASAAWVEATTPFVRADDRARLVEGLRRAGMN
jgi:TolB-like protein